MSEMKRRRTNKRREEATNLAPDLAELVQAKGLALNEAWAAQRVRNSRVVKSSGYSEL